MGAMLSSPWAVSEFSFRIQGSSLFLPVDIESLRHAFFCICNMESQAFEVHSFSAFRFDFYTLLLYCVCTNCESFKSNQQKIT